MRPAAEAARGPRGQGTAARRSGRRHAELHPGRAPGPIQARGAALGRTDRPAEAARLRSAEARTCAPPHATDAAPAAAGGAVRSAARAASARAAAADAASARAAAADAARAVCAPLPRTVPRTPTSSPGCTSPRELPLELPLELPRELPRAAPSVRVRRCRIPVHRRTRCARDRTTRVSASPRARWRRPNVANHAASSSRRCAGRRAWRPPRRLLSRRERGLSRGWP